MVFMRLMPKLFYFTLSLCALVLLFADSAQAQALYTGPITEKIWSLKVAPADVDRWLIIRANIKSRYGNLYHVEILERKKQQEPWQFTRLSSHMALTEYALRASIGNPMIKGDVYPEQYHDAYEVWRAQTNPPVCKSNVIQCLK